MTQLTTPTEYSALDQTSPVGRRTEGTSDMILKATLVLAAVAASVVVGACSGPATPEPAPTPATATSAAASAIQPCAELFKLGGPVTAGLEAVQCQEPNGLSGVNHKVVCADGRTLVFDSATSVYGFPGGVFAAQDTTAGSTYAKDYAKCNGGG